MSNSQIQHPIARSAKVYIGMVLIVFAGLMVALFSNGKSESTAIKVDNADLVAIIEEYQGDRVARVTVSINDLEAVVPEPALPAWVSNASATVPTAAERKKPKIAIIIDDLGLDKEASKRLTAFPGPLTLAFLPYAEDLAPQTAAAKEAGHELMVHLPMQSHRSSADPGNNALLAGLSYEEFSKRINWNLAQFEGFVGINNHMGSLITEDPALMVRVMARLRNEGLLFVDSLTTPNSMGKRAAKALGVPFVARDVFLDNERDREYILRQLETTEKIARLRGYAIAIGHPYDVTLEALEEWQKTLDFKDLTLVPISQIMNEALNREREAAAS
ncbi:MAG: divergent polysaccharide deacetylase family protein [Kordiimonadaceae bacterium]|nr:divergent polysaccharide deacetylase family protein [Kordiimonadaceae bacterium]MBO6570315.1 divergent polysaccharide deacetylase family protein [Kordiimonadaceae bacterium]MBO6965587.1 divergent polysaccharide deacetylase family protein [Kordiimonadaceae bacterium]